MLAVRPDVIVRTLVARGLLGFELPHRRARQLLALHRWGYGLAGQLRSVAVVSGSAVALIDERGTYTYDETVALGDRLARVLRSRGVGPSTRIGLLAPNGAEFVLALYAANLLGVDIVLLNPGLTAERIRLIIDRDDLPIVIHDGELAHLVGGVATAYDLGELIEQARDAAYGASGALTPPPREGRTIVLTSGTTGLPKGAPRRAPGGFGALVSIIERIPLHHRDRVLLCAPLFHTWGLAGLQLAFGVQATVILQRRFESAEAHAALADHQAQVLFAVPAMLQRLLDWSETGTDAGLPHLRVVASSGSKLQPGFATRFLDEFGEVLYSLYGSTETSWATIATPEQLRRAPDTAGTPPVGTRLALLDEDRRPVPDGEVGWFYVGNDMVFDGYLDGSTREEHGGLVATGDLGWREDGLYFVAGRADQLIVSGGENVHPQELDDALHTVPGIAEAAALGVPDEEFGQRLVAFVVLEEGADLSVEAIRAQLHDRVSRFAQPREIHLLPGLPRNSAGKVSLVDLAAGFPPDAENP